MHERKTIELRRSQHALAIVLDIKENKDAQQADDYASYVTKLPIEILQNGLGQALAQLLAAAKQEKDDPHRWLYDHVQSWLCERANALYADEADILQAIANGEREDYLLATQEVLAWLNWHKKLATAYLKKVEVE